ncbi:MAG: type II/IV secretion system ATPase subunit, partial [Candidatus Aenigmarchaeota archaeon]|nr:type II/IV secretion system ATPase subunit [Candidatus Aenigmarchaeota archaeon]
PLDEANPVLDTEIVLPSGRARVAAITRSLSPDGLSFVLRRHRDKPWTYPLFISYNMMTPLSAGLLSFLIDGARTMMFAGTRSAGKSSVLGATLTELMKKVRIITVEDTLELPVKALKNLGYDIQSLKSRSIITHVESELSADEAIRTSLRLGDSALIVGEVRSVEARALYESMRIGALANIVAGTIHGDSPYGVFDRVVNDLGVPATSFKATDIITIVNRLKSADGLKTYRRIMEITEITKDWDENPQKEKAFQPLMEYDSKTDRLEPTDRFLNGESLILNEIADRVKDWKNNWDAVWENIQLRTKIKETILNYAKASNDSSILEAEFTTEANSRF